jgi:hypothetical protein
MLRMAGVTFPSLKTQTADSTAAIGPPLPAHRAAGQQSILYTMKDTKNLKLPRATAGWEKELHHEGHEGHEEKKREGSVLQLRLPCTRGQDQIQLASQLSSRLRAFACYTSG